MKMNLQLPVIANVSMHKNKVEKLMYSFFKNVGYKRTKYHK